ILYIKAWRPMTSLSLDFRGLLYDRKQKSRQARLVLPFSPVSEFLSIIKNLGNVTERGSVSKPCTEGEMYANVASSFDSCGSRQCSSQSWNTGFHRGANRG